MVSWFLRKKIINYSGQLDSVFMHLGNVETLEALCKFEEPLSSSRYEVYEAALPKTHTQRMLHVSL